MNKAAAFQILGPPWRLSEGAVNGLRHLIRGGIKKTDRKPDFARLLAPYLIGTIQSVPDSDGTTPGIRRRSKPKRDQFGTER
jgi:hypothetical protein